MDPEEIARRLGEIGHIVTDEVKMSVTDQLKVIKAIAELQSDVLRPLD